MGMDAKVGSIHLDTLAVDLNNCSSCWHIRVLSIVRIEFHLQELLLLSKAKQKEAREDQRVKHLEQV